MKKRYLIISIILFVPSLFAQTADSIRTGRPGQAIGPYVVGKGMLQVQSGLDGTFSNQTGLKQDVFVLNNVIRQGLSESFELSGVLNYQQEKTTSLGTTANKDGVNDLQLGFRYNVVDHPDGWMPAVGLQTRFHLKYVSDQYKRNEAAPVILLALSHSLSDQFSLITNMGIDYNGNSLAPTYRYVFSLGQSLTSKIGFGYELYGNQQLGKDSVYAGLGFYYLINTDFQLDAYVSGGDNQGVSEIYSSVGFSWRTKVFN